MIQGELLNAFVETMSAHFFAPAPILIDDLLSWRKPKGEKEQKRDGVRWVHMRWENACQFEF